MSVDPRSEYSLICFGCFQLQYCQRTRTHSFLRRNHLRGKSCNLCKFPKLGGFPHQPPEMSLVLQTVSGKVEDSPACGGRPGKGQNIARTPIHRKGRSAFLSLEVRFLPVKDPKGAPTTKGPGGVHRCPRSNLSLNLVPRSSSFLNFTFEDTREKFLRLHSAISSADLRSYDARYSNKVELSQNNLYYLISDILSLF